jgi:hypothetical protein
MNRIIENKMLVPNLHQVTLHAPEIAQAALPGQFVILRAEEDGERIPLSIADWDLQKGTLTLVFMNIGRTTQKLAALPAGAFCPPWSVRWAMPWRSTIMGTWFALAAVMGSPPFIRLRKR